MSVRKRIWKNSKGEAKEAWVCSYTDQAGKRRLKTFRLQKQAKAFAATAAVEIKQGIHTPDSASVTVTEAADLWIASREARGKERSTIASYRSHIKFHIMPYLGAKKLSQLSPAAISTFEDSLRGDGRSEAMIRKIIGSLGSIIANAQRRALVARNVVRELRGLDGIAGLAASKRQKGKLNAGVDIPTRQEIKALVDHLQGRWRPIILTAIFTGLRSSELRGLRWADVDFKKNEIHVRQRVDQYRKFGAPKSGSGERVIPMTPLVVNTLREWKLACPKGADDLCFPTGAGTPENHANVVNRGLIPAWHAAGVVKADGTAKYTGLHALRHFYASWCINSKADGGLELSPKAAQSRLGHSSINMTYDTYGHLFSRGDDGSELAEAEKSLLG